MDVENIKVKVTYEVGLSELNIPEKKIKQLKKAFEEMKSLGGFGSDEFNEAREWLNSNIRESDCFEIEYEIEDIS